MLDASVPFKNSSCVSVDTNSKLSDNLVTCNHNLSKDMANQFHTHKFKARMFYSKNSKPAEIDTLVVHPLH